MRILIVRNSPNYMDVENNTYNIQEVGLAKALVRQGHKCDIVFWTDFEEKIVEVKVDEARIVHVFYKKGIQFLKNGFYRNCSELYEQYDILQASEYNQIQSWYLASKYPSKTVIYHGPYYSKFNKRYNLMCKVFDLFLLSDYIKNNTKFLTKSDMAKQFLVNKGIKEENISTIGVGIDIEMLTNSESVCKEEFYKIMQADKSDLKLLYVGRFEKRRNILFTLDVFKKVLEKNGNAKLYMIGTGDEVYLKQVRSYMDKLNIREKIVWQEKMEQKYLSNIYKLTDFFLLPTKYEIFGMVLLEAMYYENIIFTTKNGGSSMLIIHEKNGFVIDRINAEMWANMIIDIHQDFISKKHVKSAASKNIEQRFTWDILAIEFVNQYAKVKNGV